MSQLVQSVSEKSLSIIVYAISIVVVSLVAFLIFFPRVIAFGDVSVSYLPKFHAFINGTCTMLLAAGFVAIVNKKVALHKTFMLSTFILSTIFLVSYVIYHANAAPTTFGGEGIIRPIYYFILISHIVLASVILPLALFTLLRAWRGEFMKHKAIARWTLPLWLYVTITGVVVYLLISPYYAS